MAIPAAEQRVLQQKSGNRCAFPECRRQLTAVSPVDYREIVLGEMAHIIAESENGPRGDGQTSLRERNRADNLILLCNNHHQLIDSQPEVYTIEKLRRMKHDHEQWVTETLGRGMPSASDTAPLLTETIHSTLLPIERMPTYLYSGECFLSEDEVTQKIGPLHKGEMAPFIVRAHRLYVLQDLREPDNPFIASLNVL